MMIIKKTSSPKHDKRPSQPGGIFFAVYLGFAAMAMLLLSSCLFQQVPDDQVAQKHEHRDKPVVDTKRPAQADTLTIAAVGDIMLGTSYPDSLSLPPDSAVNSFNAVKTELQRANVTMGNLEGTLLDGGAPAHYKLHQRSKAYIFRMPAAYSKVLAGAGFDVLSLANNHISDFDDQGRGSTMRMLDSAKINYGGLLVHPSSVFTINGIRYGFCAFAPNAQTLPLLDIKNAGRIISKLKQQCDIVIVSFHGGAEGLGAEHVTRQMESYIGERRGDVYAFAHAAIDAGADMVFGNGPHVSRAMEVYNNRFIAYSLGNFCTYKSVSVEGVCGLSPLVKISVNRKGEFLSGRIIALKQTHAGGLVRDTTGRVIKRIKWLTETDFPEGSLQIADDGTITKSSATMLTQQ